MDIVYETLRKIPGIRDTAVREVATKINRMDDLATKEYINAVIAQLGTRLIKQIYGAAAIIIAAMGLMIKFL